MPVTANPLVNPFAIPFAAPPVTAVGSPASSRGAPCKAPSTLKIQLLLFLAILLGSGCASARNGGSTVTGTLAAMSGEEIRLMGFKGFQTHEISRSMVADDGAFSLPYSDEQTGMGMLVGGEDHTFVIVLSGNTIRLDGGSLADPGSIAIYGCEENRVFDRYASEHPRREQALSAWIFLENIYDEDTLFTDYDSPRRAIAREKQRIRDEDRAFLEQLDPATYVHWYLPVRKLVRSVSAVAQHRTDEIPQTIEGFRRIDYTDQRLYRSGLLQDVLDSHFWLLENSGRGLDSVYVEMNHSIDIISKNVASDPGRFREIMAYLFELLERRSLFGSSEHLAVRLLSDKSELLDSRFASELEIYRAMKIGATAPDIAFTQLIHNPSGMPADRLSEMESPFILVVFAAGWCSSCHEMMPELVGYQQKWQKAGVEVLLFGLDDTGDGFAGFVSGLPFVATTDLARWNSPVVQEWHVTRLPAMYLLGTDRDILLRPRSVRQVDAWIEWNVLRE